MRNYNSTFQVVNGLTGILVASSSVAGTNLGNAVDTIGFQSLLGVLCIGSLSGSAATDTAANLAVKFQECATANGTFTDISNGAINGTATVYGSASFDTVQVVAGSAASATPFYQRKLFIQLNDGTHKRYIRPHATLTGTAGKIMDCAVSVAILLGRARESAYIQDAVAYATCDGFITWGVTYSSIPAV